MELFSFLMKKFDANYEAITEARTKTNRNTMDVCNKALPWERVFVEAFLLLEKFLQFFLEILL
jgi:hypothetical protein